MVYKIKKIIYNIIVNKERVTPKGDGKKSKGVKNERLQKIKRFTERSPK